MKANWNPWSDLVSFIRKRALTHVPNMLAHNVVGVQPMLRPTGLIFAMKTRYTYTYRGTLKFGMKSLEVFLKNEVSRSIFEKCIM